MARFLDTSFSGQVNYILRAPYYSFKTKSFIKRNDFSVRFFNKIDATYISKRISSIKDMLPNNKEMRFIFKKWGEKTSNTGEANKFLRHLKEQHILGLILMMGDSLRARLLDISEVQNVALILFILDKYALLNILSGVRLNTKDACQKIFDAIDYIEVKMGAKKVASSLITDIPEAWKSDIKKFFAD